MRCQHVILGKNVAAGEEQGPFELIFRAMTTGSNLDEAIRRFPWAFPPESDKEDARHAKPRDWQPTRNKALAQIQAYPSSTLNGQASLPPTAYDEGEHVKEAFAHFGRAIYMASLVETDLVHVLLQADFLTKVENAFVKGKGQGFSREKYETDFDAFMQEHFGQTMANLIKRIERQFEFDEKLKKRVSTAKGRRDYLVHHFWRDRAVRFGTKDGRDQIIAELSEDAEKFEALDKDVRSALKPVREKLGILTRAILIAKSHDLTA